MTDLVTRAQIILLARTLHVPARRLAHLEHLGATHLHELHQRMSAIVFDQHAEVFSRISKLVPIIPFSVSSPLVRRVVPPAMTGRAAGAIGLQHPKRSAEALTLLGPTYAADCAPYVDARTVGAIAEQSETDPLMEIINEILRRGDYITVGPFLEYATPALVEAVELGVQDDVGLVFSAAYAYTNVSEILRQLLRGRRQRMPRMVQKVLRGATELQCAGLSVFARCDADVVADIGEILFTGHNFELVGNLVVTAVRAEGVVDLLTITGQLTPRARDTLAANPIFDNEAVLVGMFAALESCHAPAVWRGLFELLQRLRPPLRERGAQLLAALPDAMVAELPSIAAEADLWRILLPVLVAGDATVHAHIGAIWATLPPERRTGLELHIQQLRFQEALAGLVEQIPTASMEEVFFRRRQMRRHRDDADSWP